MIKTVNVSVSNVYKNSTYKSEITSQALLGESVEVINSENDFDFVKQFDGYTGWIKNNQLSAFKNNNFPKKIIISHTARIFENKDENSIPMRGAVIGCKLNIIKENDNWCQVLLPDGLKGWIHKKHFGDFPKLSRSNVVKLAKQFLGYPYFWGARSPRGFDCSGFVQTVFGLLGTQLPRDSFMQKNAIKEISKNINDANEGDILFFGDDKIKVDHVGIALGGNRIIHSRARVRINSLNINDDNYDSKLAETLIAVSTVF
jgi:gamma-D-glutamyl-L-lysine dipeptidyl-peptidase